MCRYNTAAPEALDYCTYGDYKGSYTDGRSCEKLGQDETWLCYSDYYRDDCCETCAQLKDDQYPGMIFSCHSEKKHNLSCVSILKLKFQF